MPVQTPPRYSVAVPVTAPATVPIPEYTRTIDAPQAARGEWLLTNGQGGFAMGTIRGTPTRRYHALLVAAMHPPVQREVMLHSIVETVVIAPGTDHERSIQLTPFTFGGAQEPGDSPLVSFSRTPTSCTWRYRIGSGAEQVEVDKRLELTRDGQGAIVSYAARSAMDIVRVQLRPLVRMQDAHSLLRASDGVFGAETAARSVTVLRDGKSLALSCDAGWFESSPQWWYNFAYETERDRGYDWTEDLWSPGAFNLQLRPATSGAITIAAWVDQPRGRGADHDARLRTLITGVCQQVPRAEHGTAARLVAASDDFVVSRRGAQAENPARSIIAGYPWFTDWGRDSMISCPGLLLATGRFEDARSVLSTFAAHRKNGLIPNLFNDRTAEAEYNTADASLWFLHAACEYLRCSEDMEGFETLLKPACLDIIDAYTEGTEFGIRVDPVDGLVAAGTAQTQLTWMDARHNGIVFTPRHGKPVELSALWYSGLTGVSSAIKRFQSSRAAELDKQAKRTAAHFRVLFWNGKGLHDVLEPGPNSTWKPNAQTRPNQVFAVSLPRSALDPAQQKSVVGVVRQKLLTPRGLRTLAPGEAGYIGRYRGPMAQRDAAYHNGTTWPWLIGPYAEAVMRSGGFSAKSRSEARAALAPLIASLDGPCPGHLPEVFDGDDAPDNPAQPGGCPAQAWSVAEVLRVWLMALDERTARAV